MKPRANRQGGFTLVELMIVIAIVGILAAVALPAYQDYTVRSKMSEPLAVLAAAKVSISEYFVANAMLPATAADAGIETDISTDITASLIYQVGPPTWLYVKLADSGLGSEVNGKYVSFSLVDSANGRLQWVCRSTTGNGDIDPKYLPGTCRG